MASRRLNSDRYFTADFTTEMYTQVGMNWVQNTTMMDVLLRHYPELRPAMRGVTNAFQPWVAVTELMNTQTLPGELPGTPTEPDAQVAPSVPELNGTERMGDLLLGRRHPFGFLLPGRAAMARGAGFLDQAKLILGVSGGSYMAASRALVAHGLELNPGGAGRRPAARVRARQPGRAAPARQYAVPRARRQDAAGRGAVAAVRRGGHPRPGPHPGLRRGACLGLGAALAGSADLHGRRAHSSTQQWTASLTGDHMVDLAGHRRRGDARHLPVVGATLHPGPARPGAATARSRSKRSGWAAFITVVLALAMFAVPAAGRMAVQLALRRPPDRSRRPRLRRAAPGGRPPPSAGFVVAVVAVSQSARKTLAKYNLLKTPEAAQGTRRRDRDCSAPSPAISAGSCCPGWPACLVVLAFAVAGLRWVKDGAAAGFTQGQLWQVIGALAVMLVMRFLADVNRISLHDFYRWRLATAYAVTTGHRSSRTASQRRSARRTSPERCLSELTGQRPELVMCTTANINAQREVPPGRGGLSFSFDPDHATLRGPGPAESVQARTADYEALVGPAPVHAVRRVRHQRGGLFPADGSGDAAGLPDLVHGH